MSLFKESNELFIEFLKIEKNASPITITNYMDDINSFVQYLYEEGIQIFASVDKQIVDSFMLSLYEQNLSQSSISRKLSSLRSLYKFMEREKLVLNNPFIHVSVSRPKEQEPSFFEKEELEKLFSVSDLESPLGQRNQALLELLYASGIRVSECVELNLKDLDFDLNTLFVTGKGNKDRYVLFGTYSEKALKLYINNGRHSLLRKTNNPSDHLFLNAKGSSLTTRGVRLILDKMVKSASLTVNIHPHKLRHTFATHMLNEGADLRVVQELLGHEHLSSTQIYTHDSKDRLRNIYRNSHPRAKKRE
ncbi:tyrosine recombinase XerC [Aquibacillus rhizosphaerae]|uniref:Tyrosine recombinase XerC n=1 Tax=Aquibacillus rhizosphaerae TaxID=3051431 RepID=A0ABT7L4E7_9BACI|nr:tyrosine recombinase XerC [Aquibacillus sp. LR5S19]MDL4840052.1 tyrosine recombinase XerC [Aquibacillus sp. LR5S19]